MTGCELRCHKMRNLRPGKHLLLRTAWAEPTCVHSYVCTRVHLCVHMYPCVCIHYTPTWTLRKLNINMYKTLQVAQSRLGTNNTWWEWNAFQVSVKQPLSASGKQKPKLFCVQARAHLWDRLCCLRVAVQFPIWLLHDKMMRMAAKGLHGSLSSWKNPRWLNWLTTRVFLQIVLKRTVAQNWGIRMATTKLLQHLSGGNTQAKVRLCGHITWISFHRAVRYLCAYITYSEKHKVKNEGV